MPPGIHVVESIEDNAKASKPLDVELWLLDVGMVRNDLDVRVEFLRSFLRDLSTCQHHIRHPAFRILSMESYQCLRLLDMLKAEQELSI